MSLLNDMFGIDFGGGGKKQGGRGTDFNPAPSGYGNGMGGMPQYDPEEERRQKMLALSAALLRQPQPGEASQGLLGSFVQGSLEGQQAANNYRRQVMDSQMYQQKMQQMNQPQYKTVGNTLGKFDQQKGTFEPIYTAPNQMTMPKPPAGYQWSGDGQLAPIPGGPAEKLTPEGAAKTAQIETARSNVPRIRELMVDGALNPIDYYASRGDVGEGRRLTRSAIEGYLRATSGAAVPESEVNRALGLYEPTPFDMPETRRRKLDQLEKFLSGTGENMKRGRSAPSAPANQPKPQQPIKFLGFE